MNKIYDTLYSKDSSGNIRIWRQEQKGSQYRTISGVLGSENLVVSDWSTAYPKNTGKSNETSAEEQATAEILAKYKKQLKTGYFKSVKDVDKIQYVEPMLASKYKDREDKVDFAKQSWGMQCKFNGHRCIATKDGLFTRKGEKYVSVPHINEALKEFFDKYPAAVLDGEMYNYDLRERLNELATLVRKSANATEEDLARSKEIVKFYIYDGYGWEDYDESVPYSARKAWIDKNVIGKYNYVEEVKTLPIKSRKEMDDYFLLLIKDGQEGGILRDLSSPYEHKRSKSLLKVKAEQDDEAIILDLTDGDGNWKGAATNVTLKWKGKVFDGVFKGTYEARAQILKDKSNWVNKVVTFLYMGLTGLGTPCFARVDPNNCFKIDK